jgi:hypothetical protein
MYRVGRVKYLVNYHDGVKTHKDNSPFYDIKAFKNKVALYKFIGELVKMGYKEGR